MTTTLIQNNRIFFFPIIIFSLVSKGLFVKQEGYIGYISGCSFYINRSIAVSD